MKMASGGYPNNLLTPGQNFRPIEPFRIWPTGLAAPIVCFLFSPPNRLPRCGSHCGSRRTIIISEDPLLLEQGELRRALLNANHIRYEYLFVPLPYDDGYFNLIVAPETSSVPETEIQRVLASDGERILYPGAEFIADLGLQQRSGDLGTTGQ